MERVIMSSRIGMGDIVDARTIKSFLNANAEIGEITVRDYVARLKKAGANIDLVEYPGAYHPFDNQTIPGTLQLQQAQTWRKCRLEEKPQGVIINSDTGQPASFNDTCIERGVTIGWLWTVLLFLATSAIGVMVLKRTGRGDLDRFRAAVRQDGLRAIHLETPGLAAMVGGILLVFPGFITDLMGALLFVPPLRRWASATIGRALKKRRAGRDPSVIDLSPDEWHQVSDGTRKDRRPRGPRRPRAS
jgi:UPF0716 family protein affecting phage T7 exclusion